MDESKGAPECYPLLSDVSIEQLGSGDALLLDTKQCYAMVGVEGIFMMSDGKPQCVSWRKTRNQSTIFI